MSSNPAPRLHRQYSFEEPDFVYSDDDLSSTGSLQPASSREIRCITRLSKLGQKFALVKVGDYKHCETFIRQHPEILEEDHRDFLRVARVALLTGQKQLANQCVQQAVLIRALRDSGKIEREMHFHRLMNGRNFDGRFVEDCKKVLKKVEDGILEYPPSHNPTRHPYVSSIIPTGYIMPGEFQNAKLDHGICSLDSNLRTYRHESLSRLSPLGHAFIRIPVNKSARCREFLAQNPEILDEDHELYISEALSALSEGNESEAWSAIEKSIILRDFDRRRPENVFQGLSQSVSSAMDILKERASRERNDETPRKHTSILPLQPIGSSIRDLPGGHRERTFFTSLAPHAPRAETAALNTSILQLRRENEAVEQELQSTQRVLKNQNEKVASAKKELEAVKQQLQKIHKELTDEKQELNIRLEELHSTREELQSREKELKGSEDQKQALQREKKDLEAAKKLQLLREDELCEKEKELNKTEVELDRERESIAQAKHEIETMGRPPFFDDSPLPLPATAELPATTCPPIDIQAAMEDKATQTTVADSFDEPVEFEMPRTENESDINGLRYGSPVFGLFQSAATVCKTAIQQQQGSLVSSSGNVSFNPEDVSTSFTEIDYLLETYTPNPGTEDESEDQDVKTLGGSWDRRRRWNEVVQGLKFRIKEVETREVDVEARELQVQFDQDKVKREGEIQSQRDRAVLAQQCHGCGIALVTNLELPE